MIVRGFASGSLPAENVLVEVEKTDVFLHRTNRCRADPWESGTPAGGLPIGPMLAVPEADVNVAERRVPAVWMLTQASAGRSSTVRPWGLRAGMIGFGVRREEDGGRGGA